MNIYWELHVYITVHTQALCTPRRSTHVKHTCHKSLLWTGALVNAEEFLCLHKVIVLLREMAPVAFPASLSGRRWAENFLWYVGWNLVPPESSWDVRNNVLSPVMWNMFWGTGEALSVTGRHKEKGKVWPVEAVFLWWIYILAMLSFEPQLHPHLATTLQLCRGTSCTAPARKRHIFNKLFWHFYAMAFVFITADHHCAHCKSIQWMWRRS